MKTKANTVQIGSLEIGKDLPILIQSMIVSDALDTSAVVDECIHLFQSGCPLIRMAIPSVKAAENLKSIKEGIKAQGYDIPLVADIHFLPKAAEIAAKHVEKVRINPGNFADRKTFESKEYTQEEYQLELDRISLELKPFIRTCRRYNTTVRIGVNHGSLSDRITSYFGDTVVGMVQSALEYITFFVDEDFHDLVISLKSSNPKIMIQANRLFQKEQSKRGWNYPLHLGVTEAGEGEDGRIKSALGIGTLMREGIGDTIRVSLTEDPINELPVAQFLVKEFARKKPIPPINLSPKLSRIPQVFESIEEISSRDWIHFDLGAHSRKELLEFLESHQKENPEKCILFSASYSENLDNTLIQSTVDFGDVLLNGWGDGICIQNEGLSSDEILKISLGVLQATRRKISKTEFISCPSCGRTRFDLQKTTAKIKKETEHLKGLKIGIMGCIVNGPGEMADADYGYVGSGPGKITLYKRKEVAQKNIPESEAVQALVDLIKKNGDWREINS